MENREVAECRQSFNAMVNESIWRIMQGVVRRCVQTCTKSVAGVTGCSLCACFLILLVNGAVHPFLCSLTSYFKKKNKLSSYISQVSKRINAVYYFFIISNMDSHYYPGLSSVQDCNSFVNTVFAVHKEASFISVATVWP